MDFGAMGSVRQLCQPQKIQSLHPYGLGDFAELAWLQCLWRYAGSGGKAVLWGEVRGGHQANRRPGAGHGTAADVLHTFYPALESNGSHTFLQLAITRLAIRAYAVTFKGGRVGGGSPARARGRGGRAVFDGGRTHDPAGNLLLPCLHSPGCSGG